MIGFSAGGRVTLEALFGPAATRPDFAALIYGVHEIKEAPNPAPPCSSRSRPTTHGQPSWSIEVFRAYRKSKGAGRAAHFPDGRAQFRQQGRRRRPLHGPPAEWLAANKLLSKAEAGWGKGSEELD
jgi:hypothetical protein